MIRVFLLTIIALTLAASLDASASTFPPNVAVRVQRQPRITGNVHISFRPTDRLPQSGYYYAVIVLEPYKGYTRASPPPCAISSDMQRTDYGYPYPGRPVALALTPATSTAKHWCKSATYSGAIYAVPHSPPCNSTYPCRSEDYETKGNCFELENGHKACGVVARPKYYAYPEGPPKPIDRDARIIGRFHVKF